MPLIGLLSDTHGFLDSQVFEHFKTCDEVWHAGDVGNESVLDSLADFKPLRVVYGNIDGKEVRSCCKEYLVFDCGGLSVLMIHIAGAPPRFTPQVRVLLQEHRPKLLVCGHSHILRVEPLSSYHHLLYINPGAAGREGFHRMRTLLRFRVEEGELKHMEAIELGKRGQL